MTDRKPTAPRDVVYEVKALDEMPEHGSRQSVLEEALENVKQANPRDDQGNPVWCQIGSYRLGSAASAAANQLRKRHGKGPEVNGWRITTGRATRDEAGQPIPKADQRTILAVRYEPETIVSGEAEKHAESVLKERDAAKAKRKSNGSQKAREDQGSGKAAAGHADSTSSTSTKTAANA